MMCVLILIQLLVYLIAVMLLTLLGWLADKLSRPLSPPRPGGAFHANNEPHQQVGQQRSRPTDDGDRGESLRAGREEPTASLRAIANQWRKEAPCCTSRSP